MRHNGIKDFSFLSSYTELRDLVISRNEIGTPEALSQLSSLRNLYLEMTGIENLDFLRGLDNLTRLTINEYSLENAEAIYSLSQLRELTVSKPVSRLIGKKRLKNVKYSVEDRFTGGSVFSPAILPDAPEQRPINHMLERLRSFRTSEVTDTSVKERLCSMIYSGSSRYQECDVQFSLVGGCCSDDKRTAVYTDPMKYAGSDYSWFVTYENELDPDKVIAISFFKKDHGLKMIGLAKRNRPDIAYNDTLFPSLYAHILYLMENNIGWVEISGKLERTFARVCTNQDLIDPAILKEHNVFADIEIDADDYHYYRTDDSGKKTVKKIAYGHIELG